MYSTSQVNALVDSLTMYGTFGVAVGGGEGGVEGWRGKGVTADAEVKAPSAKNPRLLKVPEICV